MEKVRMTISSTDLIPVLCHGDSGDLARSVVKLLSGALPDVQLFEDETGEPAISFPQAALLIGNRLSLEKLRHLLMDGFSPSRIVVGTAESSELERICLRELGVEYIELDSEEEAGAKLFPLLRHALGRFEDEAMLRSRIEETLGQLGMERNESLLGMAFKQRLVHVSPIQPARLGHEFFNVDLEHFPVIFSSNPLGVNLAVIHATEPGLTGIDPTQHALFTEEILRGCIRSGADTRVILRNFEREAIKLLGEDESYRVSVLVFDREMHTVHVLLGGSLDFWLLNPRRLPPIGVHRSENRSLRRDRSGRSPKHRRIKLGDGDLLCLVSGSFHRILRKEKISSDKALLDAVRNHRVIDFFRTLDAEGSGVVIPWTV